MPLSPVPGKWFLSLTTPGRGQLFSAIVDARMLPMLLFILSERSESKGRPTPVSRSRHTAKHRECRCGDAAMIECRRIHGAVHKVPGKCVLSLTTPRCSYPMQPSYNARMLPMSLKTYPSVPFHVCGDAPVIEYRRMYGAGHKVLGKLVLYGRHPERSCSPMKRSDGFRSRAIDMGAR